MSMYYTHLFVPTSRENVPTADNVQELVTNIVASGLAGHRPHVVPARRVFEPQLGGFVTPTDTEVRAVDRSRLTSSLCDLDCYDVELRGHALAEAPALAVPIEQLSEDGEKSLLEPPFRWTWVLSLRDRLVSLSNPPDGAAGKGVPLFEEPCESDRKDAVIMNPETGKAAKIPGAGSARFWVGLRLTNYAFPKLGKRGYAIATPAALELLEASLGPIVESCTYG